VQNKKAHEIVTTVTPVQSGIPRAMVLTVSFALSLVTGLSCHHRKRNAQALSPLDISVGMSGPHDFAVRELVLSSKHQSRPPHPVPTFVTIAKRPSVARDGHGYRFDLGESGKVLFLRARLDGANQIDLAQQIRFYARVISLASQPRGSRRRPKLIALAVTASAFRIELPSRFSCSPPGPIKAMGFSKGSIHYHLRQEAADLRQHHRPTRHALDRKAPQRLMVATDLTCRWTNRLGAKMDEDR
jgi:hypothetical protein